MKVWPTVEPNQPSAAITAEGTAWFRDGAREIPRSGVTSLLLSVTAEASKRGNQLVA